MSCRAALFSSGENVPVRDGVVDRWIDAASAIIRLHTGVWSDPNKLGPEPSSIQECQGYLEAQVQNSSCLQGQWSPLMIGILSYCSCSDNKIREGCLGFTRMCGK